MVSRTAMPNSSNSDSISGILLTLLPVPPLLLTRVTSLSLLHSLVTPVLVVLVPVLTLLLHMSGQLGNGRYRRSHMKSFLVPCMIRLSQGFP